MLGASIYFYPYYLDDILYDPLASSFIIYMHQLLLDQFMGILFYRNLFVIMGVVLVILAFYVFFFIGLSIIGGIFLKTISLGASPYFVVHILSTRYHGKTG